MARLFYLPVMAQNLQIPPGRHARMSHVLQKMGRRNLAWSTFDIGSSRTAP